MRRLGRLTAALLTLTATVLVTGCGKKPVVGVLLAETGDAATYGASMRKAIELAVEHAKADGTYPPGLTMVWADSATDPATAVNQFRSLAKDKGAQIVIAGTTSGEAKAFLPVLEETNTVAVSPSATLTSLTKPTKNIYRVFPSDELEGRRAGTVLRDDEGLDTVIIFAEDTEQARGIEPPFRHVFEQTLKGRVVARIVLSSADWQQQATDMMAVHSPKAAYIIGYSDGTLAVIRFLRERAFAGTICATSAFHSGDVITANAELLDGVYFPQPAFDTTDERDIVKNFVTAFTTKYGADPDIYAAHAYDATRVVFKVMQDVGVYEASAIRKELHFGIKEFPGVTGVIQFNDYGDVHHNPIVFVVKDGKVRNYEAYLDERRREIREKIRATMLGSGSGAAAPTPTP